MGEESPLLWKENGGALVYHIMIREIQVIELTVKNYKIAILTFLNKSRENITNVFWRRLISWVKSLQ